MNKQNWEKIAHIFTPENFPRGYNYASVPFIDQIKDNILKVYFSSRNKHNRSLIFWATFDLSNNFSLLQVSQSPEFELGKLGEFDEHGAMGCQIFNTPTKKYLYYLGWNLNTSTPFRNAIGAVEWDFETKNYKKIFKGPLLDRSIHDPCFVASHHIIKKGDQFYMYYLSCDEWININDKLTHKYNIKIATSQNGLNWSPTGKIAIDYKSSKEYAISVPRVIKQDGIYKMWYSYRGSDSTPNYRIGYAESKDALTWVRKDNLVNLKTSLTGWDSEMLCYPYIFTHQSQTYMLYNGNQYGATGFGVAKLKN